MCGISGILAFDGNPARLAPKRLEAMREALAHRGPDGSGAYVETSTPGVALLHRRLSIIDLEGGRQPLANEDDTVRVIFNGEIFNYVELGRELAGRGHRFRTRSDTEVLVHLYEELGDDFVHRLNGQFAIALWDTRRRRLLLVRDRPGILPLYYCERDGELLFGSEIKAILAALPTPPDVSADALRDVTTLWAPLGPSTLFKDIVEVEPGQMVIVDRGRGHAATRNYWTWRLAMPDEVSRQTEAAAAEELAALLDDATRLRLRADVDVGAFLSGGLDSSVLVGLMARAAGSRLRTFSVGFSDPELDESGYQRLVVQALGGRHSQVCVPVSDVAIRFPDVIRATEVPVTRTGSAPIHALAEHVRSAGCKVVLTGEGADEVLGGYDLFKEANVRAFCARQRGSRWRPYLLKRLYPSFTIGTASSPVAAYVGALDGNPADPGFSHEMRWAAGPAVEALFAPDFLAGCSAATPAERAVDRFGPDLAGRTLLQRAQLLEARTLMSGYLLNSQCDRMLMAHSVEGRFPYLDHRVIEFANRLDPRLKMRGLREKVLLKQVARGLVPDAIRRRPKQPYRGPDARVFFGPGRPAYVEDLLSPRTLAAWGYFNPARVAHLTARLDAAIANGRPISHRDSLAFLTVLSTHLWHAHFRHGGSSWTL
jgi:asparagine synthase (glutamine-hydrolysing)